MMKTTFTIAGNLALVSLIGLANAGYSQAVKSDAPAKPAHQATSVVVKASAAKDGTFDVEITENGKTRKVSGLKPGPKGFIELPSGPNGEATLVLDPAAGPLTDVVLKAEGKPLFPPRGAAAAQAQTRDVSVKATSNGSGTFDVEITENGKTRKLTGVKSNPDGTLDIPELKDIAAVGIPISKQNKVIRVEGKPLILPSGAAAAQAHSSNVSVKAIGNGSGTFDVEITENGKTRKLTGLKPGPKGKIEVQSGLHGEATIVIDPNAPQGGVNVKVEGKPLILPSGAAAAQAQTRDVSVKATSNGSGTFDVEITENGKTRKLTGVKSNPDGTLDIPELKDSAAVGTTISKQNKVIRVEKPLILPSGAAAAQAHSSNVSVKAIGNGSGTFDVEITENGKTRKLTGLKPGPKGKIEVQSGVAGHPPIVIDTTEGPHGNVSVKVEGKPLIFPSGAAAAQAHSSNVSVKAIGNGSGTFDVEITENGKTRKLTGLKPGPKGKIEIPSGVAGHPPILIDTTEGPNGKVSVRVEGKPLIFPSGAAAAQAHSSNVSVKAIGNGSGTFDVEITENGKTRKLTGVKAKADGSLDIPELNGDAPKGAKVEKQIKIITSDGSNAGIALPDTTNRVEIDASDIVIDAQGLPLADIASGTTVTVTASAAGKAPTIVKTERVVAGKSAGAKIVTGIGSADGQKVMLMEARPNAVKASKEVLIEAKLVNGKKVVSAPKLVVLSGQTAKIQAGDVWLSLYVTISPAGTISVKGDAGSAKSPKGPGFSVSGLASGGSFKYPNGNAGTWEIKASVSGTSAAKPGGQMFIFKTNKP